MPFSISDFDLVDVLSGIFGKRAKTKIDSMYIGIELKVVGFSASAYFQLESEARISKNFPRTDTVG